MFNGGGFVYIDNVVLQSKISNSYECMGVCEKATFWMVE